MTDLGSNSWICKPIFITSSTPSRNQRTQHGSWSLMDLGADPRAISHLPHSCSIFCHCTSLANAVDTVVACRGKLRRLLLTYSMQRRWSLATFHWDKDHRALQYSYVSSSSRSCLRSQASHRISSSCRVPETASHSHRRSLLSYAIETLATIEEIDYRWPPFQDP